MLRPGENFSGLLEPFKIGVSCGTAALEHGVAWPPTDLCCRLRAVSATYTAFDQELPANARQLKRLLVELRKLGCGTSQ
jgi:hypothetical protein